MKIHDSSPLPQPHIGSGGNRAAGKGIQGSKANQQQTVISTDSIAELGSVVEASTVVREDVVASIKNRIAAGEFGSEQSVIKTAESIFNQI